VTQLVWGPLVPAQGQPQPAPSRRGLPTPVTVILALGLSLLLAAVTACGESPRSAAVEPASASPATRAPVAPRLGACYDAPLTPYRSRSLWADLTPAVSCAEAHRVETYHVGTVDAPSGAAEVQPRSQQMFDLFAVCAAKATQFLGGKWYDARVGLQVTLPVDKDWSAGVRSYSCDMAELDQVGEEAAVRRTSSLRDALAAPGALFMGCFNRTSTVYWAPMVPAACDQRHDAEYVGAFDGVIPASDDEDTIEQVGLDGCERIVGSYLGSPDFRDIYIGYLGWNSYHWHFGRLTVQCFATPVPGRRFTGSVKGIGGRRPPTVAAG